MQLTPLQLQIQEWSDHTISFGCIVMHDDRGVSKYGRYCRLVDRDNKWDVSDCWVVEYDKPFYIEKFIGHPMDYGRLKYIYFDCEPYTNMGEHFQKLENIFLKSIERYNQTILEWDEETQIAVRDFLLSLPKDVIYK